MGKWSGQRHSKHFSHHNYALENLDYFSPELLLVNMDAKLLQERRTLSHSLNSFSFGWTAHSNVSKYCPESSLLSIELPHLIKIKKKNCIKYMPRMFVFSDRKCIVLWAKLWSYENKSLTDLNWFQNKCTSPLIFGRIWKSWI